MGGVFFQHLGIILNDEMDDFAVAPGVANAYHLEGELANQIRGGKRPLSSMTPAILTKNGKLFMVVGAPGGSRITTGVLQVILDVVDFNMNPQEAVDLPRFHHQWKPDVLAIERGVSPDTVALLAKMGYVSRETVLAEVQAIEVSNGWLEGGHDDCGPGEALGY